MQQLVQSLEKGDPKIVTTAAGLIRSAWEDLHQMRRDNIAGKQRSKLDKRPDDVKPRLLGAEEESKMNQGKGKGKGKGKGWQPWQPRTESSGRWKDKRGKGKGKGRWGSRSPPPAP